MLMFGVAFFGGSVRATDDPGDSYSGTREFVGTAITLLGNAGSPFAYGSNSIYPTRDFAFLAACRRDSHASIAEVAGSIGELQELHRARIPLERRISAAQEKSAQRLRWGLFRTFVTALGDEDGGVSIRDAAETTGHVLEPLQEAVIPFLENDLEANRVCFRLLEQAWAIAEELHDRIPARTNVIRAWLDAKLGPLGFLEVENTSSETLENCVVAARATMNEDYVERTMRSGDGVSFFLMAMGMSPAAVGNARNVDDLMIRIRSAPQGMFVCVPKLEPKTRIRFKVCDPPGMHFASNLVVRAWSRTVVSDEISLARDLMVVRGRLALERQRQSNRALPGRGSSLMRGR